MKRRALELCAGLLLLGLTSGSALAASDVRDAFNDNFSGSDGVNSGAQSYAQTFKALHTGTVDEVILFMSCESNSNIVATVEGTSAGAPDGTDPLASSASSGVDTDSWYSFHPSYFITAGTQYAITFNIPEGCLAYAKGDAYADGQAFAGATGSWGVIDPAADFLFVVRVVPGAPAPTPTPTPTPTPAATPTAAVTVPPTSTGSGLPDDPGAMLWFVPIGLIACLGGLLTLIYRGQGRAA
jgi:hypothetical protein